MNLGLVQKGGNIASRADVTDNCSSGWQKVFPFLCRVSPDDGAQSTIRAVWYDSSAARSACRRRARTKAIVTNLLSSQPISLRRVVASSEVSRYNDPPPPLHGCGLLGIIVKKKKIRQRLNLKDFVSYFFSIQVCAWIIPCMWHTHSKNK